MSLTQQEAAEIKANVHALEKSYDQTITAIKDNTKAVNDLVIEMKERDVRDEYLKAEVDLVKQDLHQFKKHADPILQKSKGWQDFFGKISDSMGGSIGKLILALIGLGVLAMLGIDFSGYIK